MLDLPLARTDIAEALGDIADDLTVYPVPTGKVNAPFVMVTPAEPYITRGDRFGGWKVGHELILAVKPGTNAKTTEDVDQLIMSVITALEDLADVMVAEISEPFTPEFNGARFPGCIIRVYTAQ